MNWTAPTVFIQASDEASQDKALAFATLSGLPLSKGDNDKKSWRISVSQNATQLIRPDGLATQIDFINGKATRRAAEAGFKKQPLARALGLQKLAAKNVASEEEKHSTTLPTVIDATAGFGTDAWMMASLGCKVTLLEQSPVLYLMLKEAIEQASGLSAKQEKSIDQASKQSSHDTASRLSLLNVNSTEYLNKETTQAADIIYLDPMYPSASKQALVKKGMQLLHDLIGPNNNNDGLLEAALNKALYRVVVKRPKGAPLLAGSEHWKKQLTSVESPNTRFDIYHTG